MGRIQRIGLAAKCARLPDCSEHFNTGVTGVTEATLVSIG